MSLICPLTPASSHHMKLSWQFSPANHAQLTTSLTFRSTISVLVADLLKRVTRPVKKVEPQFSPAWQINIYLALIVHFAKHCLSQACHQNCFDSGKLGRTAGLSFTSSHMHHCSTAGVTAGPPTQQSNQSICHNSVQFCHSSPGLYPSIYRKLSPLLVIICKGVPALANLAGLLTSSAQIFQLRAWLVTRQARGRAAAAAACNQLLGQSSAGISRI